ncbi:unnamed protein product [Prorocentrum cordatum]|uniref:Ubiquitin-like protease family profile domain-containing protein n=1 Tax=Prorocentrum cordatum TaxID=2364126 RepID=A0ABN9TW84_9DINO|nr:unnamed protein product [Polarella glacialis]
MPVCRPRSKFCLNDAHMLAGLRGGLCLSDRYENQMSLLLWQCIKGHQWRARFRGIRLGTWCPHCAGNAPLSLNDASRIADSKGGLCLSVSYVNNHTPIHWRCAVGHEWLASLANVKHGGTWCPHCVSRAPLSIETARRLAAMRGGQCMSENYLHVRSKLHWQCAEGHTWFARFGSIKYQKSWCPVCFRKRAADRDRMLAMAKLVATARGGICVSSTYQNNRTRMLWECHDGHQWEATLNKVKDAKNWCPFCASGKTERRVRVFLENIFPGHAFRTRRPSFLMGRRGRPLELDGYCESLSLAFEYNGEQHYNPQSYWNRHNRHAFTSLRERDQLKISLCEAFGVWLIIIPWTVENHWFFLHIVLLRWFKISEINSLSLTSSLTRCCIDSDSTGKVCHGTPGDESECIQMGDNTHPGHSFSIPV